MALVCGEVVQLVHHQKNRLGALSQGIRQLFVQGVDSIFAIHHKEDDVCFGHGGQGLIPDGPVWAVRFSIVDFALFRVALKVGMGE